MSTAEIYLVLDAAGTVREAIVGAPPAGAYPAGWTSVRAADAPVGAWVGWVTVGGVLVDPNAPKAPTPADLLAYAKKRRKDIVEGPNDDTNGRFIRIAISTGTKGFYLDLQARTSILGARTALLLPDGDKYVIEKWFYPDGTSGPLVGMDIERAAGFVAQVFQAMFTTLAAVVAGIVGGSVTTRDQVDAAFEALLSPVYGG